MGSQVLVSELRQSSDCPCITSRNTHSRMPPDKAANNMHLLERLLKVKATEELCAIDLRTRKCLQELEKEPKFCISQ